LATYHKQTGGLQRQMLPFALIRTAIAHPT
jgi:hypothetical protein